jgi:DNA-nicking Smr family endonuclease
VTATVRPGPGRAPLPETPKTEPDPGAPAALLPVSALKPKKPPAPRRDPDAIEPNRKKRIVRDPEAIGARIDLHGLDQDRARVALHDFIARAHADGARAVLVITGKGTLGDGVLRRRVPEWLAEAPSRVLVAGLSLADRRHGGEGALYVALKRKA